MARPVDDGAYAGDAAGDVERVVEGVGACLGTRAMDRGCRSYDEPPCADPHATVVWGRGGKTRYPIMQPRPFEAMKPPFSIFEATPC